MNYLAKYNQTYWLAVKDGSGNIKTKNYTVTGSIYKYYTTDVYNSSCVKIASNVVTRTFYKDYTIKADSKYYTSNSNNAFGNPGIICFKTRLADDYPSYTYQFSFYMNGGVISSSCT